MDAQRMLITRSLVMASAAYMCGITSSTGVAASRLLESSALLTVTSAGKGSLRM